MAFLLFFLGEKLPHYAQNHGYFPFILCFVGKIQNVKERFELIIQKILNI
jgi:hypothetical protein